MTKDDLLLELCRLTAMVPAGGYSPNIYSIPTLSRRLRETKYRIRKLIKELEADGAVKKTYEGGINDDGYPGCYHGWSITKKTADSDMFKQCYKEALEDYERFTREFAEKWEREEMHK